MVDKRRPRFHIGEQHAAALLPPVAATLNELHQRLDQYVERLHLSDADSSAVAAARDAVAAAQQRVDRLLRDVSRGVG